MKDCALIDINGLDSDVASETLVLSSIFSSSAAELSSADFCFSYYWVNVAVSYAYDLLSWLELSTVKLDSMHSLKTSACLAPDRTSTERCLSPNLISSLVSDGDTDSLSYLVCAS